VAQFERHIVPKKKCLPKKRSFFGASSWEASTWLSKMFLNAFFSSKVQNGWIWLNWMQFVSWTRLNHVPTTKCKSHGGGRLRYKIQIASSSTPWKNVPDIHVGHGCIL
jgi:hypothetical protein